MYMYMQSTVHVYYVTSSHACANHYYDHRIWGAPEHNHPQHVSLYSLDCPASLWVHFLMIFIFYLTHDHILYLMTCPNAGQEIAFKQMSDHFEFLYHIHN